MYKWLMIAVLYFSICYLYCRFIRNSTSNDNATQDEHNSNTMD